MNRYNYASIKWFAVTAKLKNAFESRGAFYGTDSRNVLRLANFFREGEPYAVLFRGGAALESVAEKAAAELGGSVEGITGIYELNDSDIIQDTKI